MPTGPCIIFFKVRYIDYLNATGSFIGIEKKKCKVHIFLKSLVSCLIQSHLQCYWSNTSTHLRRRIIEHSYNEYFFLFNEALKKCNAHNS